MNDTQRWVNRPPGSNWGDFGPDDQLGRLNLLTADKVLQAASEIRTGQRFCLSLPLDLPGGNALNPRRKPPEIHPTTRHDGRMSINYPFKLFDPYCTDVICDDYATIYLQYSTQWDSFAHAGQLFDADGDGKAEAVYYNGYRGGEHIIGPVEYTDAGDVPVKRAAGLHKLGIEHFAESAIQGRGVMIDLLTHFGRTDRAINHDDLMMVLDKDSIVVETGDMLCFHTGFAQTILDMAGKPDRKVLHATHVEIDGTDERLLNWITATGVAAIIADNYAVERVIKPGPQCCSMMPLHEHCLFKLGIPLGELWHLTPLAKWLRDHGRSHFFLTAAPLRLPGAAGSPLTPVATV